ncbi:MAG: 50S ribosomal protein L17 [Patescibacteria group bacterium]|nr:50S ribosomal protein L17 [Patescibacteria group bacterium]
MKKQYKLGRKKAHRESLLSNLARELVEHGRVKTTLAKAKALRPKVERMVTKAKRGKNSDYRELLKFFRSRKHVDKMIEDIAPRFSERGGGYTRILKLGPRGSDKAEAALIEFVERGDQNE